MSKVTEYVNEACNNLLAKHIEMDKVVAIYAMLRKEIYQVAYDDLGHAIDVGKLFYRTEACALNYIDLSRQKQKAGSEVRSTNWMIRSALHDVINAKCKNLKEVEKTFRKAMILNALEEVDCYRCAIKLIGISYPTAITIVPLTSNCDKCRDIETRNANKKYKKRKKWWEA